MRKNKNNPADSELKIKTTKLKPRNPISLNPLMKKSHAHTKNAKAERAKDKQILKKELRQRDQDD